MHTAVNRALVIVECVLFILILGHGSRMMGRCIVE